VLDWTAALKVIGISAIPFLELKVGIPVGILHGLSPTVSTVLGIIGNVLQVPLIIFVMYMLRRIAQQVPWAARWLAKADEQASKHHAKVRRYGWLGVALFVGIPFPGTGLWSGAALANLMGLPFILSVVAISIGVAMAGALIGAVASGAFAVIQLF